MRQCRWQEAAEWLARVPVSYYNDMGYAVYAVNRKWSVEPWIERQWLAERMEYSEQKWQLKENPRLRFVREIEKMEAGLNVLSGKAYQQCCYDLAVRYAQAHFTGDCWFLMRDGKSVNDTLRSNETDLAAKAANLLQQAAKTKDTALRERALFALSYGDLYEENQRWFINEWNNETYEYDRKTCANAPQYLAFAALANFEKQNATPTSQYVSRCDEFIQFRKLFH